MKQHYSLCVYGEPAVGKSVFALSWPKPFFICTDGNYEYLEDFGAKEEDHVQVHSWVEFKKVLKETDFSKYDTIVVDLLEDLYMWADQEYCQKNRIEDLGDIGYGKAYKIVRQDYVLTVSSLMNMGKNFIGLTHATEEQKKTNRGVDYIEYSPSSLIPDKCWTLINGKLRFFFRAHIEEKQDGDKIIRKRLLSVSPKPHEFQINRGMNVDSLPDDIDLTYEAFASLFSVKRSVSDTVEAEKTQKPKEEVQEPAKEEPKTESVESSEMKEEKKERRKKKEEEEKKQQEEPAKVQETVSEPKAEETSAEPEKSEEEPKQPEQKKDGRAELARIKELIAKKYGK